MIDRLFFEIMYEEGSYIEDEAEAEVDPCTKGWYISIQNNESPVPEIGPVYSEDPGFNTIDEAVAFIVKWGKGRKYELINNPTVSVSLHRKRDDEN